MVTGGAGFICSHLVDRLLAQGTIGAVFESCSTGCRGDATIFPTPENAPFPVQASSYVVDTDRFPNRAKLIARRLPGL